MKKAKHLLMSLGEALLLILVAGFPWIACAGIVLIIFIFVVWIPSMTSKLFSFGCFIAICLILTWIFGGDE